MSNAKQKIEIPGEERPLFWDVKDQKVVARIRKDAQNAGVDWQIPGAIGPAEIGRIVDELYPDAEGRKCGPAKQYRIQKLVPYLPCADEDEAEGAPEEPEAAILPTAEPQKAEPEVQAPEQKQAEAAPEAPEAGHLPPEGKPSAWSRFRAWRRTRAEDELDVDEDELPDRGWPILIVAASAFVAVWSGWVGLGKMTGFGTMDLLPGFTREGGEALLSINTAIALPLGIEAYAGYALRSFLNGRGSRRTRIFAAISGFTALILGAFGQVAYHLLANDGREKAPNEVTIFVSCLPVFCIGAVSILHYLLSMDRRAARRARRARQKMSSGNA